MDVTCGEDGGSMIVARDLEWRRFGGYDEGDVRRSRLMDFEELMMGLSWWFNN